jgi:hypothetical protein
MNSAMVDNCGRASDQRQHEDGHHHRGFGKRSDHGFAAGADAAEAGAHIHASEREEEPRAAEEGDDGDQIGGPTEQQSGRECGNEGRGYPSRSENEIRHGAK